MNLRIGMGPPYAMEFTVPASEDFDPMACVAVSLHVTTRLTASTVWPGAVISAQSPTQLTVRYGLQVGDLVTDGAHHAWLSFTTATPGQTLRTEATTFAVVRQDQ